MIQPSMLGVVGAYTLSNGQDIDGAVNEDPAEIQGRLPHPTQFENIDRDPVELLQPAVKLEMESLENARSRKMFR